MPVFAYEGRTSGGEVRSGSIEADSVDAARNRLRSMQISPTKVEKKGGMLQAEIKIPTPAFLKPKVTTKDLVIFTRQFATMIDSGLPLVQCLDIQAKQAPNETFREELATIKDTVESGATFADALKKYPATFDELYRNMVAAGEVGGILDTILNRLAVYLEKADKLKRQIKGAMMYPVITILVAAVVVAVLLLKVVPTFETMFAEFGSTLPAPTQFVIDMSKWMQANFVFIVAILTGLFFSIRYVYRLPPGRLFFDKYMLKTPVFGELLTRVAVARFCRTLGTMVASGVPILEALDICARTAGNRVIENAVMKVRDSISEGRLSLIHI